MIKCMICRQNEAEWVCTCARKVYLCTQHKKSHSNSCRESIVQINEKYRIIKQLKDLVNKRIKQSSHMISFVSNAFILTNKRINRLLSLLMNPKNQSQNDEKELLQECKDLLFEVKSLSEFEEIVADLMNLPGYRSNEILRQKKLDEYNKETDNLIEQLLELSNRLETTKATLESKEKEIKVVENELCESTKLAKAQCDIIKSKENELHEARLNFLKDLDEKDKEINELKIEIDIYKNKIQANDKDLALLRKAKLETEYKLEQSQKECALLIDNENQHLSSLKKKENEFSKIKALNAKLQLQIVNQEKEFSSQKAESERQARMHLSSLAALKPSTRNFSATTKNKNPENFTKEFVSNIVEREKIWRPLYYGKFNVISENVGSLINYRSQDDEFMDRVVKTQNQLLEIEIIAADEIRQNRERVEENDERLKQYEDKVRSYKNKQSTNEELKRKSETPRYSKSKPALAIYEDQSDDHNKAKIFSPEKSLHRRANQGIISSKHNFNETMRESIALQNNRNTGLIKCVLEMITHLPISIESFEGSNHFNRSLCTVLKSMREQSDDVKKNLQFFLNALNSLPDFHTENQGDPKSIILQLFKPCMNLISWEKEVTFTHPVHGSIHRVKYQTQTIEFFQISKSKDESYRLILENELRSKFYSCREAEVSAFCEKCKKNRNGKETVERARSAKILMFLFDDREVTIRRDEIEMITTGGNSFKLCCAITRYQMFNEFGYSFCICREGNRWVNYPDSQAHKLSSDGKTIQNCYILVYFYEQLIIDL